MVTNVSVTASFRQWPSGSPPGHYCMFLDENMCKDETCAESPDMNYAVVVLVDLNGIGLHLDADVVLFRRFR